MNKGSKNSIDNFLACLNSITFNSKDGFIVHDPKKTIVLNKDQYKIEGEELQNE